jgi:excisionase family DNA binding protein
MNETRTCYRVKELAEALDVCPETVRTWIAEGRIRAIRISPRSIRIPAGEAAGLLGLSAPVAQSAVR